MAKELGLSPRSLIKNIPNPRQPWKASVEDWVRGLHERRFGQRRPGPVKSREMSEAVTAPEPQPDAPNELELAREELFEQLERGELDEDTFAVRSEQLEHEAPVSSGEINEENRTLLLRYDSFRTFEQSLTKCILTDLWAIVILSAMKATEQADTVWFTTKGQVVIPLRFRRLFHIEDGTRAIVTTTSEGILLKPVTAATIERGFGLLKRKPDDKPLAEEWAEHKREEREKQGAKYARHGSR